MFIKPKQNKIHCSVYICIEKMFVQNIRYDFILSINFHPIHCQSNIFTARGVGDQHPLE